MPDDEQNFYQAQQSEYKTVDHLFFNPLRVPSLAHLTDSRVGYALAVADARVVFWSTRSSFAYRSLPIYDAVFSPDSTLVAFAHGTVVTLWDVEKNVLLRALEGGLKEVKQLGFVGQDGRYLATSGESSGIAMWDLLSCDSEPSVFSRLLC